MEPKWNGAICPNLPRLETSTKVALKDEIGKQDETICLTWAGFPEKKFSGFSRILWLHSRLSFRDKGPSFEKSEEACKTMKTLEREHQSSSKGLKTVALRSIKCRCYRKITEKEKVSHRTANESRDRKKRNLGKCQKQSGSSTSPFLVLLRQDKS